MSSMIFFSLFLIVLEFSSPAKASIALANRPNHNCHNANRRDWPPRNVEGANLIGDAPEINWFSSWRDKLACHLSGVSAEGSQTSILIVGIATFIFGMMSFAPRLDNGIGPFLAVSSSKEQ
jgi:hypothetical protein